MKNNEKSKVDEYLAEKNNGGDNGLIDTFASLGLIEQETKHNILEKWLKNDEKLLSYAELVLKTEKLNTKESIEKGLLELRLTITCPFLKDFKDFLEQLKLGNDTSDSSTTTESAVEMGNATFCGMSLSYIKSEPYQKNSETGVTWCSRTARCNGEKFGIKLPYGNAYDAGEKPGNSSLKTLPENRVYAKPVKDWSGISIDRINNISEGNYADIYTDSKSKYGHRAAAFKDDKGQRYVLDPYTRVNGKLDNCPKKLEDYLSVRKIVKAHFYQSSGYKESTSDMHKDVGEGYEWGTNN